MWKFWLQGTQRAVSIAYAYLQRSPSHDSFHERCVLLTFEAWKVLVRSDRASSDGSSLCLDDFDGFPLVQVAVQDRNIWPEDATFDLCNLLDGIA